MPEPTPPTPNEPTQPTDPREPSVLDSLLSFLRGLPATLQALPTKLAADEPEATATDATATATADSATADPAHAPAAAISPTAKSETAEATTTPTTPAGATVQVLQTDLPNGIAHLRISAEVPVGTTLQISLAITEGAQPVITTTAHASTPAPATATIAARNKFTIPAPLRDAAARLAAWQHWPLALAGLVYALAIGIGITRWPIYFFTDEAAHMNFAANFIRDGYKNYFGEFLPTYFVASGWMNGTSVYLQLLPFLIFGKSVLVSRLTSAIVTLAGALALGVLLRDSFKLRRYWIGVILVAITPAWFLHAHTVFEYALIGSFYSIFLMFYHQYRNGKDSALPWAVIAGALTFYTHGLGQVLMGVTAIGFLLIDLPYHFAPQRRKLVLLSFGLALLLFLPFVRYYLAHPNESAEQMARRGSYWVDASLTLGQKLAQWAAQYWKGISLWYWYNPASPGDLNRHLMKGYGHGLWLSAPFALYGLGKSLLTWRQPRSRLAIIAYLAAPVPSSLAAIGMPRMLWVTFPLALFTAIGIDDLASLAERRLRLSTRLATAALALTLAGTAAYMVWDSQTNGPTWYTDYTLYGMQYGAQQVFGDVVAPALQADPQLHFVVSTSWANGSEQFIDFFIPPALQPRVHMGKPENFIKQLMAGDTPYRFVIPASELEEIRADERLADAQILQTLPYPDGSDGFYVISVTLSPQIGQILAAEHLKDITPIEGELQINGVPFTVFYSPIAMGQISDVFDANPNTQVRGIAANPFVLDLTPAQPFPTSAVMVKTGSMEDFSIQVTLTPANGGEAQVVAQRYTGLAPEQEVTLNFPPNSGPYARILIEVTDNRVRDPYETHIRTVQLLP